jgi:hypothetical protein
VSLTDETDPHDHPPAQTPPATAQGVRRRRTVPTIQLSKPTIWALSLAVLAGAAFGMGVTQLRHWDPGMTASQGQRAIADLIAIGVLTVLFALGAMVIWAASVTLGKQSGARDRADARHEEARAWTAEQQAAIVALERLMLEQYAALARRIVGLEQLVEEAGAKAIADATRVAAAHVGKLAHRIEQVEALVEQVGKGGVIGKAVAGDIGAMRAELQVLRRDHDELSEEVGRSKVARLRPAAPPDGR